MRANVDSAKGKVRCTRDVERVTEGAWMQHLMCVWQLTRESMSLSGERNNAFV
jgi:hypothetical protein